MSEVERTMEHQSKILDEASSVFDSLVGKGAVYLGPPPGEKKTKIIKYTPKK